MTDLERLQLILILCRICLEQDTTELQRFVKACARHLETEDFNKVLRKTMKFSEAKRCGQESCPDWLMSALFKLYKTDFAV